MEMDLEYHQRSAEAQEDAPPSYYESLRYNSKESLAISSSRLDNICQQYRPPTTNFFVRSSSEPSTWELLAYGALMSNVTALTNNTPTRKRRYRILYPPHKYEDVYLHRSPWTSLATAFPPYHIEVFSGRSRYNAEPFIVLGPALTEDDSPLTAETRALACLHTPRVISAVESQVKDMTRQATFAEMEFFSCNWTCKTVAARHDMRTMVLRAKEECARSVELVESLEGFLGYVAGYAQMKVDVSLKRSCEEVRWRLEGLRL